MSKSDRLINSKALISDDWLRHHSHDIVDGLGMMAHEWVNHRRGEYAYDVHTAYSGNRKAKFFL
jgi:hypothetical protein